VTDRETCRPEPGSSRANRAPKTNEAVDTQQKLPAITARKVYNKSTARSFSSLDLVTQYNPITNSYERSTEYSDGWNDSATLERNQIGPRPRSASRYPRGRRCCRAAWLRTLVSPRVPGHSDVPHIPVHLAAARITSRSSKYSRWPGLQLSRWPVLPACWPRYKDHLRAFGGRRPQKSPAVSGCTWIRDLVGSPALICDEGAIFRRDSYRGV
jgi:hypothetical protein